MNRQWLLLRRFGPVPTLLALVVTTIPVRAHAGVDATTDCLPPARSAYVGQFQQSYSGGIQIRNPIYHLFTACDPPQSLVNFSFGLEARFDLSTDGGIGWTTEVAPAHAVGTFGTFVDRGCCNGYPQGWHCEWCGLTMVCSAPDEGCVAGLLRSTHVASSSREYYLYVSQLDISGGTLPPGVLIRVNPTLGAGGLTAITDLGAESFHIDSFFDVFTDLSLDNGQTWISADGPGSFDLEPDPIGPTSVKPSSWGALKLMYR